MAERFREFELDRSKRRLLCRGDPVEIGQLTLDLLMYLIDHRDRVIPRRELQSAVWRGRKVSPSTIPTAINVLRNTFRDSARESEVIRTVYGRGYQWIAGVEEAEASNVRDARGRARHFFGRRVELQLVQGLCERPAGEGVPAVMVCGQPGIGKSRFLEECSVTAKQRGFRVVLARCSEVAGAPALQPWHEILRQLGVGELSDLLSTLKMQPKDSAESVGAARFELLSSVSAGLRRAASSEPVFLLFDDLHCADVPTLLLLEGMIHGTRPEGVRFLGALRPVEGDDLRARMLNGLAGSSAVSFSELSGLSDAEAADLVRAQSMLEIEGAVLRVLVERGGGNPLFLEQLVRQLNVTYSADANADLAADAQKMGPSLRRVLEAEFARFSPDAIPLLEAGAVVGREFELSIVSALADCGEGRALRTLGSRGLNSVIEEVSAGVYRFTHVLHRDAIYERMDRDKRAAMHEKVIDYLRLSHGELVGDVACRAAPHSLALPTSADASDTIRLLEEAASWSESNLGFEEAVSYLSDALTVLDRSNLGGLEIRSELLQRLGGAQRRSGDPESAASSFRKGAELARLAGDPELFGKAALGFAPGFFAIEAGVVDEQLIEMLEQGLAMTNGNETALRSRLLGRLAIALYWSEHSERCLELGEEAVRIASELNDADAIAFAINAREVSRWGPQGASERAALAEWAIGLAEDSGDREMELVYRLYRMTSLLQLGKFSAVWKDLEVFSRKSSASLHKGALWYCDLLLALRAMMHGEWTTAEELAANFVELGRSVRDRNADNCAVIHEAYRHLEYGSECAARDLVEDQARIYPRVRSYECGRVFLAATAGDEQDARRRLSRLVTTEELRLEPTVEWMIGVALLAEACHILRDRRRARVLFDALSPYEDEYVVVVFSVAVWRPVSYFLARLADVTGAHDESERLYEKARRQCAEVGAPSWEAHVLFGFAEMLRRRAWPGDGLKARSLAQDSQDLATDLGMAPLRDRVDRFLWGPRSSSGRA